MIVFRLEKGSELSHKELDDNFRYQHKWKPNRLYEVEMVVLHNFSFWECIITHSSNTTFDVSKWQKISAGEFTNNNDSTINYFWSDEVEFNNVIANEGELGVKLWEVGRPVYIYNSGVWVNKTDSTTNNNYNLDGDSNVIGYTNQSHPSLVSVKDALDMLLYTPLNVSLTGGSTHEIGTVIQTVNLNWNINGGNTIQYQNITLNGSTIASPNVGTTQITLNNQNISSSRTYNVVVNDGRSTKTANTSYNFYPKLYSGSAIIPTNYTSSFILGLETHTLKSNKTTTFTTNAANNEYIWFCLPSSYGLPRFFVGGFEGGFYKINTITHTNSSGYTQNYDIWRSDFPNLGTTTVVIQ